MTKIIPLNEVAVIDNIGIFFSKEEYSSDDVIIAQAGKTETHYQLHSHATPDYMPEIKKGYTMYILKEKDYPIH